MGRYKIYLAENVQIPESTRRKRKQLAQQPCRNRRNRVLFRGSEPLENGTVDMSTEGQDSFAGETEQISAMETINQVLEDIQDSSSTCTSDSDAHDSDMTTNESTHEDTLSDNNNANSGSTADSMNLCNRSTEGNGEDPTLCNDSVETPPQFTRDNGLCGCTEVSSGDVLMMVLSLGLRHKLSWAAQVDILNMVNNIYQSDKVAHSKYYFLKSIDSSCVGLKYHYFCDKCNEYLGEKGSFKEELVTCDCGQTVNVLKAQSFFVSLSIEDQLKQLLKDEALVESLFSYRFKRQKEHADNIEDIFDGKEYQKYFQPGELLSDPHNFSYSFNTDGMPIGKSSKKTLWPIYLTINELLPEDRDKHVILAGLYIGNKDPNQNIFLDPFVDQANLLSKEGFNWECKGSHIHSHVIPLCAVVDSVARFQMQDLSSYTAYYGCTFCYNKSERTRRGLRFTISDEACELRSKESTLRDIQKVYERRNEQKRRYKGVKGPSPLLGLFYFNLISGFVPDYMHAILQGVIKTHMELLFDSTRKKFWVGMTDQIALDHMLKAIDERLLSIVPPKIVTRAPRSICDRAIWKASEWRAWLVLYCIPCLTGLLKPKHLAHLAMLSTAVSILLQKSISKTELKRAQSLILRYVFLFEQFFGKENMVYNIHLLTHVVKGVEDWGPLWTHNCFLYEAKNRDILQMYQKQLVRKFLIFGSLPGLVYDYQVPEHVVEFCESIISRRLKIFMKVGVINLLGKGVYNFPLNNGESALLQSANVHLENLKSYNTMLFKKCRFTTNGSTQLEKKCTYKSLIELKGNRFGQIKRILRDFRKNLVYVVVLLIETERPLAFIDGVLNNVSTSVLQVGQSQNRLIIVTPEEIVRNCVMFHFPHGLYVSGIPYGCSSDC